MYKNQSIAVIIPAYNESQSIAQVISELRALQSGLDDTLIDDIIVCDNASSDGTGDIALYEGARVVRENYRGYGAACQAAIRALKPVDIVVFVDADHSVYTDELPLLLDSVISGSDLVIGRRVSDKQEKGALTWPQRMGNYLAGRLIKLLWNETVNDLGPFRAIRYRQLLALQLKDHKFGWTVEMQLKAIQSNLTVTEIPVSCLKRAGRSKISGTLSGIMGAAHGIFGTIFRLWWRGSRELSDHSSEEKLVRRI